LSFFSGVEGAQKELGDDLFGRVIMEKERVAFNLLLVKRLRQTTMDFIVR
jgi:hypothetical protein